MNRCACVVLVTVALLVSGSVAADAGEKGWRIDSTGEWKEAAFQMDGLVLNDGLLAPAAKHGVYRSKLQRLDEKCSARILTLTSSPKWENWEPAGKVAPPTLGDAPIFLVKGPGDYWLFGRNRAPKSGKTQVFKPGPATLKGFDKPLLTTPYPHLFDAPGGLQKSLGGYHAWQSRDMVNWVHHGPVTPANAKWATTAEFVEGKTYIYYDFPNDQDPHLYIDDDLTDGKPGKDMGMAFNDPSDGSDCAVIRDLDGKFHVINEDWSPIDAGKHSWDSPLAGHAVSVDGYSGFTILPPAVDERTRPTGRFGEYPHPHWHLEDPSHFPAKAGTDRAFGRYEVHEPEQNAFGDWAAIAIGGRYYLVSDYHPAHDAIRIGLFTSPRLDQTFEFIGEIGAGHPDPDIGFAEGKFYLINQTRHDYVSPGPWVEKVEARVGVDTNNDGEADTWNDWQELKEQYDYIKGFAKQIQRIPATMDLGKLPAGYGFCFELRIEDATRNRSKPMLDSIEIDFSSVRSEKPLIVAHRGASQAAPENTIAAFALAWQQDADAIEGDFHLTKDGEVVCIHDKTTGKVAGTNLVVSASTLAELKALDVGSLHGEAFKGARIPSMAEVFATIPAGKKIYIEVKCGAEIIPSLLENIKHSGLEREQIIVISFHSEVIQQFKSKAPHYKAYWLCGFHQSKNGSIMPPLEGVLSVLRRTRADGLLSNTHVPLPVIEAVRQRNYEWHVYTINDLAEARRMAGLGVQSIVTDVPGYMKQHLVQRDPSGEPDPETRLRKAHAPDPE